LVIVNDLASQTLVFEHPRVVIHNLPYRFSSLGEKLNAGVGLARYDLIAPWLDDDIYLPHRLQYSIDRLDPRTGFFKARSAFFWNNGRLQSIERNAFHGGSLWTRDLFVAARGYPHHTDGVDQAIERAFARAKLDSGVGTAIPPRDNYYIYRWSGTGSYHTSVIEPTDDSPRGRYTAVERAVADALNRGDLPTGIVQLDPAWSSDYVAECTAFLTTAASAQSQPVRSAGEADEALPVVFGTRPKRRSARRSLALFDDSREARISVVLPALNEAHLERTLRQFARTLPPNSEVVVVDNGTTDTSVDFLAKHADIQPAADPALTTLDVDTPGVAVRLLRYDRPLGVSAARNRGMEHARGEVVVFSDAHVDVPDGWWAPIVETLQRREVGIVGPAIGVMGRDNAPLACGQRIADADLRVEWLPWMGPRPRPVPTLGGGFVAMRRETLEAAGAFDDGMQQWGSEDLEICLRYWMLGFEAWVVPEVEIPHYFRKASPYHVEWKHVLVNLMRTAYLHLNEERVARFLHATANNSQYTRALAACANSDVWIRRDQLRRQRKHDDDWYFHHPAFQDISMELRDA
jgi:glycosyltransferase involved in cell wall biosynthesis